MAGTQFLYPNKRSRVLVNRDLSPEFITRIGGCRGSPFAFSSQLRHWNDNKNPDFLHVFSENSYAKNMLLNIDSQISLDRLNYSVSSC